ncbi:hypothetical protein Csa_007234 [Cucumis sativus]|uniref:Uncharacterized protein n=1 Tax=Cucumis sativus TaxID=3659 RepID=A0A0A0LXZ8_CUCSA|nr:hypothetical protein Csa_007234 [Cucumis sativus]
MRQEEAIYHDFTDLESRMGRIRLDDGVPPKYKHMKHYASKIDLRVGGPSEKEEIKVPTKYSDKVKKFIKELEVEEKKKKEEERKRI